MILERRRLILGGNCGRFRYFPGVRVCFGFSASLENMEKENTTNTKYKRDGRYSTYEAAVKAECPQIEEPIAEIYLERISALKPTLWARIKNMFTWER